MQGFAFSRALLGLQCVGAAQASLDETWRYVTERQAFGDPLSAFQGVTFPLAEGETRSPPRASSVTTRCACATPAYHTE
jgi:cyclohexanecarboxyl-CoA dehydrogenase